NALMIDEGDTALLALVHVSERMLKCGASDAGKRHRHVHVGEGDDAEEAAGRGVAPVHDVLLGKHDFVEEDFALRQRPLPGLVERLALAYPVVEGNQDVDQVRAALGVPKSVAVVALAANEGALREGA